MNCKTTSYPHIPEKEKGENWLEVFYLYNERKRRRVGASGGWKKNLEMGTKASREATNVCSGTGGGGGREKKKRSKMPTKKDNTAKVDDKNMVWERQRSSQP